MESAVSVNITELVDIQDVHVDQNLTKEERVAEFVRQIRNPYCFKCGKFIVHARYAEDGDSLEDCLKRIMI